MDNINKDMARMVAEMREVGELPAPSKGGSHNNLLRYNEMRERILEKFLSAFDAGYTLTPLNEWVSVEERLPDTAGEFLVVYHPCYWDNVSAEICIGIDSFRGKTAWAKRKYQRVTHWMPLPEPPKED